MTQQEIDKILEEVNSKAVEPITYKGLHRRFADLQSDMVAFISKNICEQHNGLHVLDDLEMFYEAPHEDDNRWLVTRVRVCENGRVEYVHRYFENNDEDWYSIYNLCLEDLLFVASLYQ